MELHQISLVATSVCVDYLHFIFGADGWVHSGLMGEGAMKRFTRDAATDPPQWSSHYESGKSAAYHLRQSERSTKRSIQAICVGKWDYRKGLLEGAQEAHCTQVQ